MRNAAPVAVLMPDPNLVKNLVQKVGPMSDLKAIADPKPEAKVDPIAAPVAMPRSPQKADVAVPDLVVLAADSAPAVLVARSVEDLAGDSAQAAPALVAVSDRAADVIVLGSPETHRVADEAVAAKTAPHVPNRTESLISPKKSPGRKKTQPRTIKISKRSALS